jgi:hypothetical protein
MSLRSQYPLRTLTRGLRVPITCSEACEATVELRLNGKTAKRLKLKATAGSARRSLRGRDSVVVKLSRKAASKLRRQRRGVALLVVARASDAAGNTSRTATRRIRVH